MVWCGGGAQWRGGGARRDEAAGPIKWFIESGVAPSVPLTALPHVRQGRGPSMARRAIHQFVLDGPPARRTAEKKTRDFMTVGGREDIKLHTRPTRQAPEDVQVSSSDVQPHRSSPCVCGRKPETRSFPCWLAYLVSALMQCSLPCWRVTHPEETVYRQVL